MPTQTTRAAQARSTLSRSRAVREITCTRVSTSTSTSTVSVRPVPASPRAATAGAWPRAIVRTASPVQVSVCTAAPAYMFRSLCHWPSGRDLSVVAPLTRAQPRIAAARPAISQPVTVSPIRRRSASPSLTSCARAGAKASGRDSLALSATTVLAPASRRVAAASLPRHTTCTSPETVAAVDTSSAASCTSSENT